jgi:GH15 family glucan-1,4-alpha-glucosidase
MLRPAASSRRRRPRCRKSSAAPQLGLSLLLAARRHFTLLALMNSGYTEEASAWHHWLLRAAAGSRQHADHVRHHGPAPLLEWEATWLPGYEGAKPVRVGNAAHAQLQLDVYGELIDAFHQWRVAKLELDETSWALECTVLQHLAGQWDKPDHGIWERRGEGKHYVLSKVMTWVAFDRGIKSAETFGFKAPLVKWRVCATPFIAMSAPRDSTRAQLLCRVLWLEDAGRQHPAAAVGGFLPPEIPRARHAGAVERHLMRDGFVLRHDPREVGAATGRRRVPRLHAMAADAYVLAGEFARRRTLFARVVAIANDLGLLAEEYDTVAGRQTGNFPQALTHIALINTAHNLSAAKTSPRSRRCSGRNSHFSRIAGLTGVQYSRDAAIDREAAEYWMPPFAA